MRQKTICLLRAIPLFSLLFKVTFQTAFHNLKVEKEACPEGNFRDKVKSTLSTTSFNLYDMLLALVHSDSLLVTVLETTKNFASIWFDLNCLWWTWFFFGLSEIFVKHNFLNPWCTLLRLLGSYILNLVAKRLKLRLNICEKDAIGQLDNSYVQLLCFTIKILFEIFKFVVKSIMISH